MTGEKRGFTAAAYGVLTGILSMAMAELAAALIGRPQAGPPAAVGSAFIDLTPGWLKDFAIRTFGSADKLVLLLALAAGFLLIAAAIGLAAPRRPRVAIAILSGVVAVAGAAVLTRPAVLPVDVLPSAVAVITGVITLRLVDRRLLSRDRVALSDFARNDDGREGGHDDRFTWNEGREKAHGREGARDDLDRRVLLTAGAGMLGLAALAGGGSRAITALRRPGVTTIALPRPARPAPPLPAGTDLAVPGLSSFTTPATAFYRVDTALVIPQVDPHDWTLRIHGLVDHPVELTLREVLARPLTERDITLTCVSNEVGGPYAGNARWLGLDLAALLRQAGVQRGAAQLLSRSADGWSATTPLETILDGRDALLAIAMNGRALPPEHGFPARLIVPGLYGYASATKWVTELRLVPPGGGRSYWTRRGWAERAPIKTASRIEVPKPFATVPAGPVMVAGTAWAQHRGIAAVEVGIDDGPWRQAQLAATPGPDTWRQWKLPWNATPGRHRLQVRAVDATGAVQTSRRAPTIPDGATGWHSVLVTVT
ncbi:molybdopterin-dependent oxidoreductase [Streptosporangium sp. NPDC048047]|uniref:molybdopterin-dependent oxidoreductase n=1 Tax=Streptosporangium sp. NPDC048047 TaxID=3155748 RepID=UPI00342BA0CE